MSWRKYARKPRPRNENWKNLKYNPNLSELINKGHAVAYKGSKWFDPYVQYKARDTEYFTEEQVARANADMARVQNRVRRNPFVQEAASDLAAGIRYHGGRSRELRELRAEHANRLQMGNEEDRKRRYDEEKAKKDYLDVKYAEYMPKWRNMSATARKWIRRDGNEDRYKWPSGPQQDHHVRGSRAFRNKLAAEKLQRENKRKRNAAESLEEARRYIQQRVAVPKDLKNNIIDLT